MKNALRKEIRLIGFKGDYLKNLKSVQIRDGKSWFNHDLINPFVID